MEVLLTAYLTEHKLRKTEERYRILKSICSLPNHFDVGMIHQQMEEERFRVSKATLYNTIDVLTSAGLIVRHQVSTSVIEYELRVLADTHLHLVCTKCGVLRELKKSALNTNLNSLKVSRFTPEFYSLYVYGVCSKCKYKSRIQKTNK